MIHKLYFQTTEIILAYLFVNFLFLILSTLFESFKGKTAQFLNISNGLLLFILVLRIILSFLESSDCILDNSCLKHFIWEILFGFSFPLIFFWRNFRIKIWATVISIFSLLILIYGERVAIVFSSMNRDYLPSSLTYYTPYFDFLQITLKAIVYLIICWGLDKWIKTN